MSVSQVAPRITVPFLDPSAAYRELRDELDSAWRAVMLSGSYVLGAEVERFEVEFAALCGRQHCVGVGSGLDALRLILEALGVGPGDEVLVPGHTFIATWLAVSAVGARPVPVEPEEETFNLDSERIDEHVTSTTRAIIPVHLYGQPAEMDAIRATARRHGLLVVEDAAQAHGARYKDRPTGSMSDAAAFSFYPGKNLGAFGDGGAVVTDDEALADRVRLLRSYGSPTKYEHKVRGYNSRLDELAAALLRPKLNRLEAWNRRRAAIAGRYLRELAGAPGIRLPSVPAWVDPAWHLFVIRCHARDRLQQLLADRGIETLIHYPTPPHRTGAYASEPEPAPALPLTERICSQVVSLPIGPHMSDDDCWSVIEAVRDCASGLEPMPA